MNDVLTQQQRQYCMSRIRGKDTAPEKEVRRVVHGLGYRFRLHSKSLPGRPDLVFAGRRKVIFVHGCFWHRHDCRLGQPVPATRRAFWQAKLLGNKVRDRRVQRQLRRMGWSVLVVWECQTKPNRRTWLVEKLMRFLQESDQGE